MAGDGEIKKSWCTYWYISPSGVGRVERDSGDVAWIRYSDGCSPFPWEKRFIKRFNTAFEAILELGKYRGSSIFFIVKRVAEYFPSEAEKIWRAYEKYAKTAK